MNRDEAKALLPILTAFAEGKTIQRRGLVKDWVDETCFGADLGAHNYRIKPEPRLRAWKPEEAPSVCVLQCKRGDDPRCLAWIMADGALHRMTDKGVCDKLRLDIAFIDYVRIAEDGTEHPCGILEATEAAGDGTT